MRTNLHQGEYSGGASNRPQVSHLVHKLQEPERTMQMSRNFLFIVIVVLAVCAIGAGYLYYQERQSGIDIEINENGVTIDGN